MQHQRAVFSFKEDMNRLVTKPTKWHVRPAKTQISLGICYHWVSSTHWVHSKDAGPTGRMPRRIWVFAGSTVILLVLSWGGSYKKKLISYLTNSYKFGLILFVYFHFYWKLWFDFTCVTKRHKGFTVWNLCGNTLSQNRTLFLWISNVVHMSFRNHVKIWTSDKDSTSREETLKSRNKLRHDKTNKMSVRPAKIQTSVGIRPVWSESSLGGCPGWSESSLGAQSLSWFCHVAVQTEKLRKQHVDHLS